jgi:TetR/AcrR family transcriptional repressor of nem operon
VNTASTERKKEILEVAAELLQTHSFGSFSYADLSERLAISKASIHHHFATKQELTRALVERYRESRRRFLATPAPGSAPWAVCELSTMSWARASGTSCTNSTSWDTGG